jgi:subtilase family serine protease
MFQPSGRGLLAMSAAAAALVAAAVSLTTGGLTTGSNTTGGITTAHPAGTAPDQAVRASGQTVVSISPGARHLRREARLGPATTAECEQALQVACYNPSQVQQAYHLPALYAHGITGRGRTIVIMDPYGSPTIASDLSTFDSQEGLPNPAYLRIIQPVGRVPRYDPNNSLMVGWASETTLDVEWAHAIAPGAGILLVETPGSKAAGGADMTQIVAAENYVIKHHLGAVISQSFDATEQAIGSAADVSSLRSAYLAANAAHITVLAGSGDSGATNLKADQNNYYTYPVIAWPASDPLVTAVGGTRLDLNASGNRNSADTVWNDTYNKTANEMVNGNAGPNPLAVGGGKSIFFGRPGYQNPVAGVTGNHRGVPDISMSASCLGTVNVYQGFGGQQPGWYPVCGTSESTPMFAGIVALAAQVAGHPIGLINPALYKLAAEHAPGIVNITSGNNTVTFRQGGKSHTVRGFSARAGFNLATGLGTINAADLVPELAHQAGH